MLEADLGIWSKFSNNPPLSLSKALCYRYPVRVHVYVGVRTCVCVLWMENSSDI